MLSEALRLIRVFHDLKQAELAERLGLSKSYVSEIENNKKTPTLDVVEKYASEFSIPASSILFFSETLNSKAKRSDVLASEAKNAIASKILSFLNFIEVRTADDGKDENKISSRDGQSIL